MNDVENMKSLLRDKFGFEEKNIVTLINGPATRKAILNTFQQHLIVQAKQGDLVVFHYSGHRSRSRDAAVDGDEADQFDETIVPQDSRKPGVLDIPDDSIDGLLRSLSEKTDNVTLVFDSCHSGTVARAAGKVRTVEKDERPRLRGFLRARRAGQRRRRRRGQPEVVRSVLLSGCRSDQLSHDIPPSGRRWSVYMLFCEGSPGNEGETDLPGHHGQDDGKCECRFGSQAADRRKFEKQLRV